jgi:hypothetical protein
MNVETIRELDEVRPFQPFVLHLADGRNVKVDHPEFIAIAPDGDTVVVFKSGGGVRLLDTPLITEAEKFPGRRSKMSK